MFRSSRHLVAQVIDDADGRTLVSASTMEAELRGVDGDKSEKAKKVGELVAERAKSAGVSSVVFDRGGYRYAGRVAALAEGAALRRPGFLDDFEDEGRGSTTWLHSAGRRWPRLPVGAEKSQFLERVVAINRVAKVVKGGRRFSFTALVVVGDGDGTVGVGYGRPRRCPAIAKGVEEAKKNFFKVPRIQGTIPIRCRVRTRPAWCCCARHRRVPVSSPVARCACSSARHPRRAQQVAGFGQLDQHRARHGRGTEDARAPEEVAARRACRSKMSHRPRCCARAAGAS